MQITSWKCRGLGNPIKTEAVKDLMKMTPSEILFLQETKIKEQALLLIRKNKWKMNYGKAIRARGSCGGLATLWCEENFQLEKGYATQHWIFSQLFHYTSKTSYALFNLYIPVNYMEKKNAGTRFPIFLSTIFWKI